MDTKACRGAVNLTACNDASDMKSCDGSKKIVLKLHLIIFF